MVKLLENITNDLKSNLKYFIAFLGFFLFVFYAENQISVKNEFQYRSEIIFTHPNTNSQFVNFNNSIYRQDLYHFLIKPDTKENINSICNISDSFQKIEMNFKSSGFVYTKITLLHNEVGKNLCLDRVFNKIILTYFDNYLENIINNNKMLLEFLKKEEELKMNSSIYLSTLSLSYRPPEVIEYILNKKRKIDINHFKVVITSTIFSALITLILSNLFPGFKKKNRKKR